MFQFPGFPSLHYLFMQRYLNSRQGAFPHSDTCGSLLICSSPQLFAACHVLLRRLMPRHPPYALSSLISRSPLCSSHFGSLLSTFTKSLFLLFSNCKKKRSLPFSLDDIFVLSLDTSYLSRASLLYSLSSSLSLSLSSFSVVNVLLSVPTLYRKKDIKKA